MSKILELNNGTQISFTDVSTPTEMITVFETYGEIDAIRKKITADTLDGATFDGEELVNLVPVSCNASAEVGESVTVTFINRYKTDLELLQESQAEQDAAINELLGF